MRAEGTSTPPHGASPSGYAFGIPASLAPPPPPRPPRGRGIAIFVILLLVAAAVGVVVAAPTQSWYPNEWDARVAPIAAKVQKLRGLNFEHPVRITFLAPAEFEKKLGVDESNLSAEDRAAVERDAAVFRSLGWINGSTNLQQAYNTEQKSGTLAFYSYIDKEIFVRGTTIDAAHKVTLAHELTHVLQDQHFDLTKLTRAADESDTGDAGAYRAVVEGDAVRVEDEYLKGLSRSDRAAYNRQNDAEGERYAKDTKNVPAIFSVLFGAPYSVGPVHVEVLAASGGNTAVNSALTGAIPNTHIYLAPGDLSKPPVIKDPVAPKGTTMEGTADTFGPFELYLAIGADVSPARALEAADVVTGGRYMTYRQGKTICTRARFGTATTRDATFVERTLRDWARRHGASVERTDGLVGFRVCDPGKRARAVSGARLGELLTMLEFRSGVVLGAVQQGGLDLSEARCVARVAVQRPEARALLQSLTGSDLTQSQQLQLRALFSGARQACVVNRFAGLP